MNVMILHRDFECGFLPTVEYGKVYGMIDDQIDLIEDPLLAGTT